MEAGQSYESALGAAREQGFAEADPSLDIDGWDSTAKAVILGQHLFGISIPPMDIPRQGIRDFPLGQIKQARKENRCIRLVSRGIFENGQLHLEVSPLALPPSDPLAMARGTVSALTLCTDLLGEVTITGPGAGSIQTAAGVLSDLLRIHHRFGA
jgi:homoserine dehydrogenase